MLRPPEPGDRDALVAQRDDERYQRFMPGLGEPNPTFVVLVDGDVVGWVDFDRDERSWLTHDEVNIGYGLRADARGKGYATRAVDLLLQHLGDATDVLTATLLIDPDNDTSLAVPARCGFDDHGVLGDHGARFFKRPVPPSTRRYADGVIVLRPPVLGDRAALIALRDDEFRRHIGDGSPEPRPTFCITVDDAVVGWVDHDSPGEHEWLTDDEVNVGYALHPDHRGNGYATRAVQLLLHHLAHTGVATTASLSIDHDNPASQAIAARAGFERAADQPDHACFKRRVPPLTYTDGVVTIRAPRADDADAHLAAVDDVQIDWLWEPWQRADWESKSPAEQLDHQVRFLRRTADEWGTGPKWWFVIEHEGEYAGHVDADLANPHVPPGEANISYSMGPTHRGRGLTSRAARLALRFTREHTGAREAHVLVHPDNEASLRVARSVGATEVERTADGMVRHVLSLRG